MRQTEIEVGNTPGNHQSRSRRTPGGPAPDPSAEAGERSSAPRRGLPLAGELAEKMMYPLVSELAADGIPVAVSLRVLKLARQVYYRWLANPVTVSEVEQAHRANALHDAHLNDPEFGFRRLRDEAEDAGQPMVVRTAWQPCHQNQWPSAFGA